MQVARQGLVFDTLTERAADGTLHGELATAWQSEGGGREWRFDLRPGVRFHDGAPMRARDVAVSLARALGSDDTVAEAGQRKIVVTLDVADPSLPLRLSEPDYVIRPADQQDGAIGTGLYRVRHFSTGQQLIAARVGTHYKDGRAGWFDEVELVSVPRGDIRAQALAEGMIDAADIAAGQQAPESAFLLAEGCAASRRLAQPAQIGTHRPMDNLRAAERWWFA